MRCAWGQSLLFSTVLFVGVRNTFLVNISLITIVHHVEHLEMTFEHLSLYFASSDVINLNQATCQQIFTQYAMCFLLLTSK